MDEAFPFGPSYGNAIYRCHKKEKIVGYLLVVAIGISLAYGLMVYLT